MRNELVRTSKFLSLVLRHKPETIGLELDGNGWADVDELLALSGENGRSISMDLLLRVVRESDKQRFGFNADESKIRANQGHSVSIDLGLAPEDPPKELFHGTATRFVASIREKGILRGNRQHVHLSSDRRTATKVGQRHGEPVVLVVDAGGMSKAGYLFYLSENGVWLSNEIPAAFVRFPENAV